MTTNKPLIIMICIYFIITYLTLIHVRDDIYNTIHSGNDQIISTLKSNSCFHLEIPPDTLDETGKEFKTK